MTNPYNISNPAPRYLDPLGVNHLGYVDPVRRLQEQRALRNLSSRQPQRVIVAPGQAWGPDTGPGIQAGPGNSSSQWANRRESGDGAALLLLIAVLLAAVGIIVGFNLLLRRYWRLSWVRFCGVAVQVYLAAAITAVMALDTGALSRLIALPVAVLGGSLAARFGGAKVAGR
jgi:hypothetical protein